MQNITWEHTQSSVLYPTNFFPPWLSVQILVTVHCTLLMTIDELSEFGA